jgi:hypothetical protein
MRLTLRTLLAYLDEVLEPEDAEELAGKIRESDFASGLTHRIRNSMSQLRLTCPDPLAKGLAEDANSVGEYIDSTLPDDRIADFERVCLESDMHLSEVSACHQIVTWVVREPADVDPGMRDRIRTMGASMTGGHLRVDDALADLEGDEDDYAWKGGRVSAEPRKRKPDYMEASRKRRNTAAPWIVLALAGFLCTVGFMLSTAGDHGPTLEQANRSAPSQPAAESLATPVAPELSAVPEMNAAPLAIDGSDEFVPPEPGVPTAEPQLESEFSAPELNPAPPLAFEPAPATGEPTLELDSEFPIVDADATATEPALTSEPTLEGPFPADNDLATNEPATSTPADMGDDLTAPAPMTDAELQGDVEAVAAMTGSTEQPAEAGIAEDSALVEREPIDAGRFISDREVLAYWDQEAGIWGRVAQRASLELGVRYRVPSAFRPQLLLGDGTQLTIDGRSEFVLDQPDEGNSPLVRVSYGRMTVAALGQEADRVHFTAGGQAIQVRFGDSDSEFALEVTKLLTPGENPITGVRQQAVRIWTSAGRVGVMAADQETRAVEAGQRWASTQGSPGQIQQVDKLPNWVESAQVSDIDRNALMKIEPLLDVNRSLTLSLSEAAENRRQEVRALAARCLASLERFEPLTASLADAKQHPAWPQQFRELQAALARNPETAERVLDALRTTSGQDAETLFRMLWGYSKTQFAEGAAEELLGYMEGDTLSKGVLAFQNLHAATKKTLYYRPEQSVARRKEATTQWRRQLASGQVVYEEVSPISATD